MNSLLDLFHVAEKCDQIDNHDAEKAYTFLSAQLNDNSKIMFIKNVINMYIIKLNFKETVVNINIKPYVERWSNYEDKDLLNST